MSFRHKKGNHKHNCKKEMDYFACRIIFHTHKKSHCPPLPPGVTYLFNYQYFLVQWVLQSGDLYPISHPIVARIGSILHPLKVSQSSCVQCSILICWPTLKLSTETFRDWAPRWLALLPHSKQVLVSNPQGLSVWRLQFLLVSVPLRHRD